jgi:glycosyltransferase involved in cell wall biosynthesis
MGAEVPELIDDEEKQTLKKQYGLSDAFTVGIVGRIEEGKGQYLVIDAVKQLLHEGLNIQALIVGHAMHERYLENLKDGIKKDHLEDKIIFSGFTREAQKLMQIFDCLVLATERETFGLVLIEAMACQICTIGTNNAGPLEIIDDEKTGLLFEKNSSDDLAKKIRLLMNDEEFKNRLAQAGKEKANEVFESEKQFEKLYEILEKL